MESFLPIHTYTRIYYLYDNLHYIRTSKGLEEKAALVNTYNKVLISSLDSIRVDLK